MFNTYCILNRFGLIVYFTSKSPTLNDRHFAFLSKMQFTVYHVSQECKPIQSFKDIVVKLCSYALDL